MHSYEACINQKSAIVLGMKSMYCICYFVNRPPTLAFPCILSFVVLAVQWLIFVWNHWHSQSNLWFVLFCCPNRALKIGKWLIYSNNNEDQKLWLTSYSLFSLTLVSLTIGSCLLKVKCWSSFLGSPTFVTHKELNIRIKWNLKKDT